MPITIKRPKLKEREASFCKCTVICMIVSLCFTASLFLCMNTIVDTGSRVLTTVVFGLFAAFLATCGLCLYKGAMAYRYEDSMSALGKSIIYVGEIIICLMNLRFGLSLLLAAYGLDDAAERIVGSAGTQEFIRGQYVPWVCILSGLMLAVMVGVFGAWKLIRNK